MQVQVYRTLDGEVVEPVGLPATAVNVDCGYCRYPYRVLMAEGERVHLKCPKCGNVSLQQVCG